MEQKEKIVLAFNEAMEKIEINRKNSRLISGNHYISNKSCFKMPDGSWHRVDNGKIGYICNDKEGEWGFINNNMYPCLTLDNFNNIVVGFSSEINSKFKLMCFNPFGINYRNFNSSNIEKVFGKIIYESPKFTNLSKHLVINFLCNNSNIINSDMTVYVTPKLLKVFGSKNLSRVTHYKLKTEVLIENVPKYVDYFSKIKTIASAYYPKDLNYNFNKEDFYGKLAVNSFKNFKISNPDYDRLYKDVFKGKSFGLEIETFQGKVDHKLCAQYGMVPLRDGSLEGGIEYTSIPFYDGRGIDAMLSFYEELQRSCRINEKCSFHIHLGGYKRTRKSALVLYKLCHRLQEELFDIMPIYKKSLQYWNSKREAKDHCQSLKGLYINIKNIKNKEENSPEVKAEFNKLFKFLTEGREESGDYNFDNKNFPKKGHNKWNLHSRYYWVNFLPYVFSDSETVEFRIFNSPLDGEVALYYLLMSVAILNFAENSEEEIINGTSKITLEDVITDGLFDAPVVKKILKFVDTCRENNFNDYVANNWYAEINRQNSKFELDSNIRQQLNIAASESRSKLNSYFTDYLTTPKDYYQLKDNTEGGEYFEMVDPVIPNGRGVRRGRMVLGQDGMVRAFQDEIRDALEREQQRRVPPPAQQQLEQEDRF